MVSIRLIMNGGIIDRANKGTQKYSDEEVQEQIKLAYAEWQTAQWTENAGDAATFMQSRLQEALNNSTVSVEETRRKFIVTMTVNGAERQYTYNESTGVASKVKTVAEYSEIAANTKAEENSKYTSDGKTAIIPEGYAVSSVATEQSINTGLVIKEVNDDPTAKVNEWVWIPVANVMDLYQENSTNTEWKLCGTDGENKVVTSYASKSGILSGVTRTTPGTTSNGREPDTVVGDGTQYDAVEANYGAAGFGSLKSMAEGLKDDYKNMIESVRKYKGFYIGRYELSSAGTKKGEESLTHTNWYNLYSACKSSSLGSGSVVPRMIWGCQWDQVCKFIETAVDANGNQISLSNSTKYGNYRNSDTPANGGNWVTATKQNTGSNEAWKTNNIYDLAGNCWEWTQEALSTMHRAVRGGEYWGNGSGIPVTKRDSYGYLGPGIDYSPSVTSRPVLYIK